MRRHLRAEVAQQPLGATPLRGTPLGATRLRGTTSLGVTPLPPRCRLEATDLTVGGSGARVRVRLRVGVMVRIKVRG